MKTLKDSKGKFLAPRKQPVVPIAKKLEKRIHELENELGATEFTLFKNYGTNNAIITPIETMIDIKEELREKEIAKNTDSETPNGEDHVHDYDDYGSDPEWDHLSEIEAKQAKRDILYEVDCQKEELKDQYRHFVLKECKAFKDSEVENPVGEILNSPTFKNLILPILEQIMDSPIYMERFDDPKIAPSGHTFNKEEVQYVENQGNDPITKELLEENILRPHFLCKSVIELVLEMPIFQKYLNICNLQ